MEYQRFVAVEKQIKEIDSKNYGRVKITGTIVSKENDSLMVDDGTGTVKVFLGEMDPEKFSEKQLVCIIGRVAPTNDNQEIQAEIIRNAEGLDVESYKKTQELWRGLDV